MSTGNVPLVLVTESCDAAPLQWLRSKARVEEVGQEDPRFDRLLRDAHGLMVRTYTRVDEALLAKAPNLKAVGRGGVGLENIDIPACRRRGVEVVYTPDANTHAVGDFVFGYIIHLLRPYAFFRDAIYEPAEFKRIRNTIRGHQLDQLTIGIVGMGRVGRRVGHIAANGFGMRVIYNDLVEVRERLDFPAESVDLPKLFRESDVLSLHVDMRPGNENLVDRPQLAMMKPSAIVLNTCRGEVLNMDALAWALREKRLAGAAIDVFHPEPPKSDFPLLGMENVLLTPHVAARTYMAMENMSWVVRDIIEVIEGRKPKYPAP